LGYRISDSVVPNLAIYQNQLDELLEKNKNSKKSWMMVESIA
jgi:hypothetical protein